MIDPANPNPTSTNNTSGPVGAGAPPTTPPPPPPASTAAEQPPSTPEPEEEKKSHRWLIILVVVASLLIVLAVGALALGILNRPETTPVEPPKVINDNSKNVIVVPTTAASPTIPVEPTTGIDLTPTVFPEESPTPTQGATAPEGFKTKTTLCYKIVVPEYAMVGEDNGCRQYMPNSADSKHIYMEDIEVVYAREKANSLDAMVNNRIVDPTFKLIEDKNITVGGVPARELTEVNDRAGTTRKRVFVYVPGKYKEGGINLAGFEITAMVKDKSASEAENRFRQTAYDKLISTWQWR